MSVKRYLVQLHRWLGVRLCLLFAMWFASGAVLVYVPFPTLSQSERIESARHVDTSEITVSPYEAISATNIDIVDQIRLIDRNGRPLYVLQPRSGPVVSVWADDGLSGSVQSRDTAREIAEAFGTSVINRIDGPVDYDQWIVPNGYDRYRPFYRAYAGDEESTVYYVSLRSGEVLQATNRSERTWNYFGAVIHWIYPTVLRKNWATWDQVVWWLSLIGILLTIVGIWLGIDRAQTAIRARHQISLYRGWMRWHHILGLSAGIFVLSWIFSGWLSMDHGRLFMIPNPTEQQIDKFRGTTLSDAAHRVEIELIRDLGAFHELEIGALSGSVVLITRSREEQRTFWYSRGSVQTGSELPKELITSAVKNAWPDLQVKSAMPIGANDTYSQVRQSRLPADSLRFKLSDSRETWIHVDPRTGEILAIMDSGRRLYRWLYHGLHSLDIPALVRRRPLWDFIVVSFMAIGFAFSVTGICIGFNRIRQNTYRLNRAKV